MAAQTLKAASNILLQLEDGFPVAVESKKLIDMGGWGNQVTLARLLTQACR